MIQLEIPLAAIIDGIPCDGVLRATVGLLWVVLLVGCEDGKRDRERGVVKRYTAEDHLVNNDTTMAMFASSSSRHEVSSS
jgi:hypothetical protein